jgi:acetyl-CoA C-acetyltransferase
MSSSVIVAAKRTPIGKYLGGLSKLSAVELGMQAAKAVLGETDAISQGVDEVFVGCVLQAGLGQNPARQVALKAGLPETITAVTLNKVCGSGLEAVMQADRRFAAEISRSLWPAGSSRCRKPPTMCRARGLG